MTDGSRTTDAQLDPLPAETRELQGADTLLEAEMLGAERELAAIRTGIGWRVLTAGRHFRRRVLPPGTWRNRAVRRVVAGAAACLRLGIFRTIRTLLLTPGQLPAALRAAHADGLLLNRQYQAWIDRHRLTPAGVSAIREDIQAFTDRPVVSILMPVFNTDEAWLGAAVESILQQLYPHWELCIVDDASKAPHIRPFLRTLADGDRRVTVKVLDLNEGISGASNHALALATGEFVGLVDHDDVLAPEALYEVVKRLNADSSIDLVYSDHDIRDPRGVRRNPFFKPDWSPDLLLSMNYVTHFCVYRRELIERAGGFRKGMEGSQDYDLLLRATELTRRIEHIAKPLYSWGQAPTSVAANPRAKPYAHEAGRRALEDTLKRRGIAGEVLDGCGAPFRYRVKRTIVGRPSVSIVVPTRDNWRLLERCVRSLEARTAYRPFEILIVDNDSRDPETLAYLERVPHRVVRFREPFNFARMNNRAAAAAAGSEHLVFLNDDTEVIGAEWLEAMLEHSQRSEVGAVGARLLFPNRTIQHAGVVVGIQGKAGHAFWGFPVDHPGYYDFARVIRNFSAVTGACLMIRRAVFEELEGFDEAFDISYNDVDLCLRLRQRGYLVVYTPYALLYHHQSASRGVYDPEKDRRYEELLRERWRHVFEQGDPYYNPHLTLSGFDFSLRV
ncbi:MAG: glycosyltransferase [Luteitalea sp.]|nr:glycosyltransferase [Luteitalea sp.]